MLNATAFSASYQIDDEAPVAFAIPRTFFTPELYQKYFETPMRESRAHTSVKYLGQASAMPLSFAYMDAVVTDTPVAATVPFPASPTLALGDAWNKTIDRTPRRRDRQGDWLAPPGGVP